MNLAVKEFEITLSLAPDISYDRRAKSLVIVDISLEIAGLSISEDSIESGVILRIEF